MSQADTSTEWPVFGPDDPPLDFGRENVAFEKERARPQREHLGKIALIHENEVIGVFASSDEALREGYRRFGLVKMVLKEIRNADLPEFITHVDVNHPSFQRLD